MIEALFLAAILSVTDPAGDTFGDGSLRSPTDIVFRTPGVFDAQQFDVHDTPEFGFSLTMGHLNNPWGLPNGFSLPIIEIYLDTGEEGLEVLLPGSGMKLPPGRTWNYAFRMTGDTFEVFAPNSVTGEPTLVTDGIAARLVVQDNTLIVTTTLERPPVFSMYGMVGSYDPFRDHGWRPVLEHPSPWTLSSETQRLPVVDVIADTVGVQEQALQLGVLPEMRSSAQNSRWLLVAGFGVLLGLVGVAGRFMIKPVRPGELHSELHTEDALEPEEYAVLAGPTVIAGALEDTRIPSESAPQRELPALPPPSESSDFVYGRNGRGMRSPTPIRVDGETEGPVAVSEQPRPEEADTAEAEASSGQELALQVETDDQEQVHDEAVAGSEDDKRVDAALTLEFDDDAPDPLEQGWDFWGSSRDDALEEDSDKTRHSR